MPQTMLLELRALVYLKKFSSSKPESWLSRLFLLWISKAHFKRQEFDSLLSLYISAIPDLLWGNKSWMSLPPDFVLVGEGLCIKIKMRMKMYVNLTKYFPALFGTNKRQESLGRVLLLVWWVSLDVCGDEGRSVGISGGTQNCHPRSPKWQVSWERRGVL